MNAGMRGLRPEATATGSVALAAGPRAVQRARAFLDAELAGQLDDDQLGVAALLVSELVTNAVVHAASALEVSWELAGECVTIAVRDADTGPLAASGRRAAAPDDLAEGGRGLLIVDRLSAGWGTEHGGGRKTVWFWLPVDGAPAVAPGPSDEASPHDGPVTAERPSRGVRDLRRHVRGLLL